jgi:hypothetical protein
MNGKIDKKWACVRPSTTTYESVCSPFVTVARRTMNDNTNT